MRTAQNRGIGQIIESAVRLLAAFEAIFRRDVPVAFVVQAGALLGFRAHFEQLARGFLRWGTTGPIEMNTMHSPARFPLKQRLARFLHRRGASKKQMRGRRSP